MSDLQFDAKTDVKPAAGTKAKPATDKKQKPPNDKKSAEKVPTGIHASECVINSECTFTAGCRGRLKTTNPIGQKVQVYCPKCGQFAEGTRPANGMVAASGLRTFDRTTGKPTED